MKKYIPILLMLFLCSCKQTLKKEKPNTTIPVQELSDTLFTVSKSDTLEKDPTWMASFKEFRTSISEGDKIKVKTFVDFPLNNENNEIWYLAYSGDENDLDKITQKEVPFTELDFDKHFKQLFPRTFIKSILKINADVLYATGEFETPTLKHKETEYKTYATYDKKTKILMLNVLYETPIKVNDGEKDIIEKSESSVIYYFKITRENKIKFQQVRLAG